MTESSAEPSTGTGPGTDTATNTGTRTDAAASGGVSVPFRAGREGYASFRIPAVVATGTGTLLAFCEGRVGSAHDHGDIDIVLKRSADGGRTWGPLQAVAKNGANLAGNPRPSSSTRAASCSSMSAARPPRPRTPCCAAR